MTRLSRELSVAPAAMRGTSGTPRHTKLTRYRCCLPALAGFAGNRCTEPEVPPIGDLRRNFSCCRIARRSLAQRYAPLKPTGISECQRPNYSRLERVADVHFQRDASRSNLRFAIRFWMLDAGGWMLEPSHRPANCGLRVVMREFKVKEKSVFCCD